MHSGVCTCTAAPSKLLALEPERRLEPPDNIRAWRASSWLITVIWGLTGYRGAEGCFLLGENLLLAGIGPDWARVCPKKIQHLLEAPA